MILGVKGEKNSGKTTLIENLLHNIEGKVVVIKSSSKETFDTPGKDTWRYRKAGAEASIIVGKKEAAIFSSSLSINDAILMAKKMHPHLIIMEGYENVKGDVIVRADESVENVLKLVKMERRKIEIFVDGKKLPLNNFISELFYKTIKAMLSTLKNGEGKEIDIVIND